MKDDLPAGERMSRWRIEESTQEADAGRAAVRSVCPGGRLRQPPRDTEPKIASASRKTPGTGTTHPRLRLPVPLDGDDLTHTFLLIGHVVGAIRPWTLAIITSGPCLSARKKGEYMRRSAHDHQPSLAILQSPSSDRVTPHRGIIWPQMRSSAALRPSPDLYRFWQGQDCRIARLVCEVHACGTVEF